MIWNIQDTEKMHESGDFQNEHLAYREARNLYILLNYHTHTDRRKTTQSKFTDVENAVARISCNPVVACKSYTTAQTSSFVE